MSEDKGKYALILLILLGLFILSLVVFPFIGIERITFGEVLYDPASRGSEIFWKLRVPRVLAGMLCGGVLSAAGLAFQAMFRNPLATPFTLGTASGASLGAGFYIWAGWSFSLAGISGLTLMAFLGAAAALSLVYGFSRWRRGLPSEIMLLSGVAISIFFSSLILLLQYMSNQAHSLRILRWLMGGLEIVGYREILEPLPLALVGLAVIFLKRLDLNLLTTGEDLAAGRGVNVNQTKVMLLLSTGLMVGAVVAVAGPVAFVGLIVPHVCRLLFGPDHRILVIASVLMGAVFLSGCDALARIVLAPAELPVGIITSLLGGPFFIWMLLRDGGRG